MQCAYRDGGRFGIDRVSLGGVYTSTGKWREATTTKGVDHVGAQSDDESSAGIDDVRCQPALVLQGAAALAAMLTRRRGGAVHGSARERLAADDLGHASRGRDADCDPRARGPGRSRSRSRTRGSAATRRRDLRCGRRHDRELRRRGGRRRLDAARRRSRRRTATTRERADRRRPRSSPRRTAPVNTAEPVISGSPVEGSTLSAIDRHVERARAITFTYQWVRCGADGGLPDGSNCPSDRRRDELQLRARWRTTSERGSAFASPRRTQSGAAAARQRRPRRSRSRRRPARCATRPSLRSVARRPSDERSSPVPAHGPVRPRSPSPISGCAAMPTADCRTAPTASPSPARRPLATSRRARTSGGRFASR